MAPLRTEVRHSVRAALRDETLPLTLIEWADLTLNPILGCDYVGPECIRCYAPHVMLRQASFGREAHAQTIKMVKGKPVWTGEIVWNSPERRGEITRLLARSRKLGRPLRVFVAALSDLFHPKAIAQGMTREVYRMLRDSPGQHYIILTKRPEAAAQFYRDHPEFAMLPGVWLGVSVGLQGSVGRIDVLRTIPVEQRIVSFEPLLEAVSCSLHGIDWAIIGGESAKRLADARRMDTAWAEALLDICLRDGVAVFYKQMGSRLAAELGVRGKGGGAKALLRGRRWAQFPVPPAEARRRIAALESEVAGLRSGALLSANEARDRIADRRAADIWPHVSRSVDRGMDNEAIARALTAAGVPTPAGGTRWFGAQVARVRKRMGG